MNCFHFWVSLGYNTTITEVLRDLLELWIAFIFEYLWDTTQRLKNASHKSDSCELLSFLSIFGIQHNQMEMQSKNMIVVNCFHFWVSLGYNTTWRFYFKQCSWLWIAFIFEYLWDTTQHYQVGYYCLSRCELLSFLSIFGIQHNHSRLFKRQWDVVNCFHFWVSLGYNTTSEMTVKSWLSLWIAFIFEYLWDTTQLFTSK